MFNDNKLWKERLQKSSKEMTRYLRYIFNGHLVVVMLFLLGTLSYYYQAWVDTLSPQFPVAIVMSLLLVIFVTHSPTYTFLLEADKIFLLAVEKRLTNYFRRANILSLVIQSYILLLILAALMPMYVKVNGGTYGQFFYLLGVLIILKGLNLLIQKYMFYYVEPSVHLTDYVVRFSLNLILLYFLFSQAKIIFVLLLLVLLVFLYIYFRSSVKEKSLKWDLLIDQEEKRANSFYRLANMFTDVPQLKEEVKRRKYADFILNSISYGQEATYKNLLARTFIRSGDYFGLFIRLTIIGGVVIYFINSFLAILLLSCLFIYLTGFQLTPLRLAHENNTMTQLYPLSSKGIDKAAGQIIFFVLLIQSVVFASVSVVNGNLVESALLLIVNIVFAFLFVRLYIKRLMTKQV